MTQSERESKSFCKAMFAGNIAQDVISPFPEMDAEEKENLNLILTSLRQFAKDNVDSAEIDRSGEIPKEVLEGMAEMGLFGMSIPEAYGGYGFSVTAYNRVFEEVAAIDASLAVTFGAHQSIGLKALILHGTEEQKKKFLPQLASGEKFAAFALTEPGAGSDAAGIKTTAVKNGDHYILNGNKIWITNGGFAHFFTVFAKTEMENGEQKITAFAVTRDMEGFSSGKEEEKLGIHGSSTTEINFDNIKVPAENVIGPLGKGFKVAMEVLNSGRLGLAAGCLGGVKKLLQMSAEHAKNRQQFNTPIAKFEMIQEKITAMAVDAFALESMVYMTTGLVDRGDVDYSIESAVCKVYASEAIWRAIDHGMQVAGGIGYSKEYSYERALRDARINLIFEGANEILRSFIALSGMQEHGEYLKTVGKALKNPLSELGVITDFAIHRIKSYVSSDRFDDVHDSLSSEVGKYEEYVKELHSCVEKALTKYRKDIIHQGFILERIADMTIDLFGMAAVISRLDGMLKAGNPTKVKRELTLGKLFCEEAWRRIRRNSRQVTNNADNLRREVANDVYEFNGYNLDLMG